MASPRASLSVAFATAALALSTTACANLGALLCSGSDCADASTDAPAVETGAEGGIPGIACGDAGTCDPVSQECCMGNGGSTSCVALNGCGNGSDIFCTDPRQCGAGGTCWACVSSQGFAGTSCNYQSDILGQWHCTATQAFPLCEDSNECTGGTTCQPVPKPAVLASTPPWLEQCQ